MTSGAGTDDRLPSEMHTRMERGASWIAAATACIATCALSGWALGVPGLYRVLRHGSPMKANTGVALLALSIAAFVTARWRSRAAARGRAGLCLLAGLIAGSALAEHLFGVSLHVDQLIAADPGVAAHPGRMSIGTASLLLLMSTAIATAEVATKPSQIVALATLSASILTTLSYAYGPGALTTVSTFSTMAFPTAAGLLLLSVATMMLSPARDPGQLLGSPRIGGTMLRRMLPVVVLAPPVVGYARLIGQRAGLYGTEFGLALFATANVMIVGAVVYWNARLVSKADERRRRSEEDRESLLRLERAARERAEEASRAKDKLLSVVSHELRTPLTPVSLLVRAIEEDPALPEALREDVAVIREQVGLEVRLINDLLDLASMSSAQQAFERRPLDLGSAAQTAMEAAKGEAVTAGVTLTSEVAPGAWVSGDEARLGQIVRNLVDNAIKFTPRGKGAKLSLWHDDREAVLEVRDEGVGMNAEEMAAAFEPFVQGDSSLTRKFGGMGIGLTIARRLAAAHGGTLTASSEGPGKGASFRLTLPRVPPPAPPARAAAYTPANGTTRLLLVEDNAMTLKTLARLLTSSGLHVTTAASAGEALEAARKARFDLVVSDIGLPDTDGWELFSQLRQIQPVRGIALSGFVTDEDRQKSMRAGFQSHLDKPVDIQTLLAAIRKAG